MNQLSILKMLFMQEYPGITDCILTEEDLWAKIEAYKVKVQQLTALGVFNSLSEVPSQEEWIEFENMIRAEISLEFNFGDSLTDDSNKPWVHTIANRQYWNKYKSLLEEKGWFKRVIKDIDSVTEDILDQCGDPNETDLPWQRRGLVIGDVQSGKTAVFTGLINKASDAGYKVIIVLTGILETLRNQTQSRLEKEYVRNISQRPVACLTSIESDFNINATATNNFSFNTVNGPVLFVVKKNLSVLKALTLWLTKFNYDGRYVDYPLLLIDDEADNASINTRKDGEDPTRTNKQIRELLKLFKNATYVGFTATPFANVFIDSSDPGSPEADLFPSNFIRTTSIPNNYFGAEKMLGENELEEDGVEYKRSPYLCEIEDAEPYLPLKHKNGYVPYALSPSLKEAIRQYLLCNAIMDLRSGLENSHRSMMVNVSRFTCVQNEVSVLVENYVDQITDAVRIHGKSPLAIRNPQLFDLKVTFDKHYQNCGVSWESIQDVLYDAIKGIEVFVVNTSALSKEHHLNYEENKKQGLRAIVVGGMAIARGVTLEGLCVSYLYRSTIYSDTLMQMGRWFGYRLNYQDLCRVWLSSQTADFYRQTALATNELKALVGQMKKANLRPQDFGLRVRQSPDALLMTSRNKMRHSKRVTFSSSWNGYFTEVTNLLANERDNNLQASKELIHEMHKHGCTEEVVGYRKVFRNVPKELIASFINKFNIHPHHYQLAKYDDNEHGLANFILGTDIDKLQKWDVVIDGLKGSDLTTSVELGCSQPINCIRRHAIINDNGRQTEIKVVGGHIGGSDLESITLSDSLLNKIKENPDQSKVNSRLTFRKLRQHPLLILHPMMLYHADKQSADGNKFASENLIFEDPTITFAISFCNFEGSGPRSKVTYLVTDQWLKDRFGSDYEQEEE